MHAVPLRPSGCLKSVFILFVMLILKAHNFSFILFGDSTLKTFFTSPYKQKPFYHFDLSIISSYMPFGYMQVKLPMTFLA